MGVQMKYKIILQKSDEGIAVSVPGLPGCHSQGKSEEEAIVNIKEAIVGYLDVVDELSKNNTSKVTDVKVKYA